MIALGPMPCSIAPVRTSDQLMVSSFLTDAHCSTEQALRSYEQDQHEDDERRDVLELWGDHDRRELDEQPDDQAADHGSPDRAEAAEGHRGEHEEKDLV